MVSAPRVPFLRCCLGLVALLLTTPTPSFGQPGPPPGPPVCTNFDNNTLAPWTVENATHSFEPRAGGGSYIELQDRSGGSNLKAPANLLGNLAAKLGCGQFCFDVNLIANDPAHTPRGGVVSLASPGITASFVGNQIILPGSGWHTLCAPLSPTSPGKAPPTSPDGVWNLTPATADWNTLLANVTALTLPVDWGSSKQDEVVGYDNLCFRPGTCAKADFTFTSACAGEAVQLTSTSTGTTSSTPYSWTFSGGTPATSTAQNPSSSFASAGNRAVTLCINGGTTSPLCITKPVFVKPKPPTPVINGPLLACNSPATYCVNPAAPGVTYGWTVSNGTLAGISTGQCVQVIWTNPQQGGALAVAATNQGGCTSRAKLDVKPCTSWVADCCRCGELSVKDEKLAGSTFTASLTASPSQVTRVAVDLISTSVVPFGPSCGSPGSRDSNILGGSLQGASALLPVPSPSREILFTYATPTPLSAAGLSLNLQLPPLGPNWWCGDSLSFCLKYSFTGRDCKTCELIECYGPFKRGGIILDHVLDDVTTNVAFDLVVDIPAAETGARPPTGKALLRLKPGSGNSAAKLSGRVRTEIAAGAVSFSGLMIDRPGEGYVLELLVDGTSEPVAASEPFTVKPPAC